MQVSTGKLYDSRDAAKAAGVPDDDLVEIVGTREQATRIGRAVSSLAKAEAKRKRKQQKRSRRINR